MTGTIIGRKATLPVTLLLPGQPRLTMEFVLDTGYEGALTLPVAAVELLQLPFSHRISANLADDSAKPVSVHIATILWNDTTWEVPVLAMGKRPLLGTLLLENHDIALHFTEGGAVEIRPF